MNKERRVVITGIGIYSPLGNDLNEIKSSLIEQKSAIVTMPEWDNIDHLKTRVAGVCKDVPEDELTRQEKRTMGRVAILSVLSVNRAIEDSGLPTRNISSGRCGVSYGSTEGSSGAMEQFLSKLLVNRSLKGLPSTTYLQFMSHTCASNIAMKFKTKGPVLASCTACTSGSQGIGYGYEQIVGNRADIMLCGGAEEMHFMDAGIFDLMRATSIKYNETPHLTPRPFDKERDGLVVGEGAGCFVLEEYEHAKKRNAYIYAEVLGYGTNCDGSHITNPCSDGMAGSMERALEDAGIPVDAIDHINAHATATEAGDIAESIATAKVFGNKIPVSAYKGYMGHTLGAAGVIESAISIIQMNEGFIAPIKNLKKVDSRCADIHYMKSQIVDADIGICINNNFAFGGINTSLIFKKV